MKRRIIAVALAVAASPAFALDVGAPYEQVEVDRQLPNIEFAPVAPYKADEHAPYEQLVIDRMLPDLPTRRQQFAGPVGGNTRCFQAWQRLGLEAVDASAAQVRGFQSTADVQLIAASRRPKYTP